MLLTDILPKLALELEQLLKEQQESELAAQVPSLVIVDRCPCGDDFCSSFYTQPKSRRTHGLDHRTLLLDAKKGMIILDVVSGVTTFVEVLKRDDVREQLTAALP